MQRGTGGGAGRLAAHFMSSCAIRPSRPLPLSLSSPRHVFLLQPRLKHCPLPPPRQPPRPPSALPAQALGLACALGTCSIHRAEPCLLAGPLPPTPPSPRGHRPAGEDRGVPRAEVRVSEDSWYRAVCREMLRGAWPKLHRRNPASGAGSAPGPRDRARPGPGAASDSLTRSGSHSTRPAQEWPSDGWTAGERGATLPLAKRERS